MNSFLDFCSGNEKNAVSFLMYVKFPIQINLYVFILMKTILILTKA